MKKYLTTLPYLISGALMAMPLFANAELPPGQAVTLDEVNNIFGTIARFLIGVSATLAVIFIIISGIMIMTAQGDPAKYKKGREMLKTAIWGTFVVLGVGVIINTVAALVTRSFFCQLSVLGVCLY